jgi:4-amino-4-deoxy-L-arabinose transferase-like glycosyltransferase
MDNDSAHHADIALRMYLNRDYVNLVDAGKDYLDKPHLLFWLCAFSYKIFGVSSFAYKFPSFCFTILGTYSTYRLGKALYDKEVGKLAALLVASSFAYMLANNDVRMDAILTACVALATWQGVAFLQNKKMSNAIGLALGLALGFCTKGHIALFIPAVGLFFYILYTKNWLAFRNWKWVVVLLCFALFISPVVYCYYLQFNLHPEKIVRGRDHINGVKFILFGQSVERFRGETFGGAAKNDYLFFFHSFLWAFAPWSILAYIAFFNRIKNFLKRKDEWLSPATVIAIIIILTFSGFKLPHYLNIIFPATAVMTSSWIIHSSLKPKIIYSIQLIVSFLLLSLVAAINVWAFPVKGIVVIIVVIVLLAVAFYFLKTDGQNLLQKSIGFSASAMIVSFFLLNANFYPQLLTYQGGNELAKKIKGNVDAHNVYFWRNNYSSSFNFCTVTERKQFDDSLYSRGKRPIWLLFDKHNLDSITQAGYKIGLTYSVPDFEITKLNLKFVNPSKRSNQLTEMVVGEITGRR